MDHTDHTNLLRGAVHGVGSIWADLGAGSGAFTLALADLLGPEGEIHAVDRDARVLTANAKAMKAKFPTVPVHYYEADFTLRLELPPLDGIVMANSLHFSLDQDAVLRLVREYLRPSGRLAVVEYNTELPGFAVPYPVPFTQWRKLARNTGFTHTELLMRRPARFLGEIYSAVSW